MKAGGFDYPSFHLHLKDLELVFEAVKTQFCVTLHTEQVCTMGFNLQGTQVLLVPDIILLLLLMKFLSWIDSILLFFFSPKDGKPLRESNCINFTAAGIQHMFMLWAHF